MSFESNSGKPPAPAENTIRFGQKYAESANFSEIFEEGMALVESTAAYLDGDGRTDAKALESPVSLAYATESMRLTTRLMQLASWLLVRRAVNEGEMTPEQAIKEQDKVKFQSPTISSEPDVYEKLPERLRELNDASIKLYRRVISIDKLLRDEMSNDQPETNTNEALGAQFSRLTEAFGPISEDDKTPDEPANDPA